MSANVPWKGWTWGDILKILINKAEVDTIAMALHVRENLQKLDIYIREEAHDNITKFNKYVHQQIYILTTRGETTNDMNIKKSPITKRQA